VDGIVINFCIKDDDDDDDDDDDVDFLGCLSASKLS
jgi:hypothetical protein